MRFASLAAPWLFLAVACGHSLPPVKRQTRDFAWALVGYAEPDCKGAVVANWRGSNSVPTCIPITATQSIAGGSGDGTSVNLWEDETCAAPSSALGVGGQDANGYPCYNVVVRSFTVDK
ncbi:hypothetical protein B0T25DRAFT_614463 [Lasiosphaeria hispida]|uniref:Uncharacterized protein n=1 Tax=Lasiosphaeria hispida TaxID=260671 RepID=A0AAJ0H7W3_9PEZI|nr:hypothetical protein B0T25DRAFT_614463 [Lasiosphaeria hispida]